MSKPETHDNTQRRRVMRPHPDFIRSNGNRHNDIHFEHPACHDYPECYEATPTEADRFVNEQVEGVANG